MKKFRITVDGNQYDVEVEELSGESSQTVSQDTTTQKPKKVENKKPKKKSKPKKSNKKKEKKSTPTVTGGQSVKAPMPGTVLSIAVSEGDKVDSGDLLLVLEAMKMENPINSESAGTVKSIECSDGESVESGDVLIVIG